MTVRSRGGLFADDEELGKKDDDRKPSKMGNWSVRTKPSAWRKRRIVGLLLGCVVVYLFIANIPKDMGEVAARIRVPRPDYRTPAQRGNRAIPKSEYNFEQEDVYPPELKREDAPAVGLGSGQIASEASAAGAVTKDLSYDGPVRFYLLAASLHNVKNIVDFRPGIRHVLFAASDLKSAAALIPIACEMAGWKRNTVHFAIMGRDKTTIPDIMEVNGATGPACPIYWHDARPDHGEDSTGPRMQLSVSGAMNHIVSFMHPQAVITADAEHENVYFTTGMSRSVKAMALTHIEIPKGNPEKLAWLARLDAGSLNAWHSAGVDILVQAPLESSGSMIRLLRSLEQADFSGFAPPRLTIELPHKIDQATQNFLTRFKWPPYQYVKNPTAPDELITRRRISEQHISSDEASLRFVESFYPSSPKGPHVLLLSPQAELSPAFFHYLKLHLLEFRHSLEMTDQYRNLFGISLETPTMYLNGTTKFVPPVTISGGEDDGMYDPFRWQAPDSNAALYFSDKWIEFHSFLTKRRTATLHSRTQDHHASRTKLVSRKQPSWVEYALDIMRNRGYSLHYPGLFSQRRSNGGGSAQSLVIVHNELYQAPEEYTPAGSGLRKRDEPEAEASSSDSVLTVSPDALDYLSAHHPVDEGSQANEELPLLRSLMPLLPMLELETVKDASGFQSVQPRRLPLPNIARIPLLDYEGEEMTSVELEKRALKTRVSYRHLAGGCSDKVANVDDIQAGSAEDLFCLDDDREGRADTVSVANSDPSRPRQAFSPPEGPAGPAAAAANVVNAAKDTVKNAAAGAAGAAAAALAPDAGSAADQTRARQPVLDAAPAENLEPLAGANTAPQRHTQKQSFEEEMAARDAARNDQKADRARNAGDKQAQALGKMRAATEADVEIKENLGIKQRPRAGKVGTIRVATEDDDEEGLGAAGGAKAKPAPPVAADHAVEDIDERGVTTPTKTSRPGDLNAPISNLRGTGAAEHINAVENPAKYAETARAGFLKKTGADTDANKQAAKLNSLHENGKDANDDAVSADAGAPQPTTTRHGPADPNAPQPRLRATGAAAHINAAEDPKKYVETARAKFLQKMEKLGKGKIDLAPGNKKAGSKET